MTMPLTTGLYLLLIVVAAFLALEYYRIWLGDDE